LSKVPSAASAAAGSSAAMAAASAEFLMATIIASLLGRRIESVVTFLAIWNGHGYEF